MGEKEICMGKVSSFYMQFLEQQRRSRVLELEGIHSGHV
jgi:hypothetical protein